MCFPIFLFKLSGDKYVPDKNREKVLRFILYIPLTHLKKSIQKIEFSGRIENKDTINN